MWTPSSRNEREKNRLHTHMPEQGDGGGWRRRRRRRRKKKKKKRRKCERRGKREGSVHEWLNEGESEILVQWREYLAALYVAILSLRIWRWRRCVHRNAIQGELRLFQHWFNLFLVLTLGFSHSVSSFPLWLLVIFGTRSVFPREWIPTAYLFSVVQLSMRTCLYLTTRDGERIQKQMPWRLKPPDSEMMKEKVSPASSSAWPF